MVASPQYLTQNQFSMDNTESGLVKKNRSSIGRNGTIRIANKNTRTAQSTDGTQRDFSNGNKTSQFVQGVYQNATPSNKILLNSREEEAVIRQHELSLQYKKLKVELDLQTVRNKTLEAQVKQLQEDVEEQKKENKSMKEINKELLHKVSKASLAKSKVMQQSFQHLDNPNSTDDSMN